MAEQVIVINSNASETRVALLEGSRLVEISMDRKADQGMLGNIYKGKVSRVLPGMNAAFIDIGESRAAFLFGGDVINAEELARRQQIALADPGKEFQELRDEITQVPIERLLRQGQDILVQIIKEPIGSKGARASMFLSIAGRYLVLIPYFSHVGISRRIQDEAQRQKLRDLVTSIKSHDIGVIIRTAAVDIPKDLISKDLEYLMHCWDEIQQREKNSRTPSNLFKEAELPIKAIRDIYTDDVQAIVVDHREVFDHMKRFLDATIPGASSKLKLYEGENPIFDTYDVEMDLARALSRKVWLPSGGYLIIDQTEALTSFDVNTGRFVGKLSARETILKTNLEAVDEIAAQLRLRNIGGIIVLDFIDMENLGDRETVFQRLEQQLSKDKAKVNVLKISELGLVQMTRKRTSESLERSLTEECPHCEGKGHVRSKQTVCLDLLRDIERYCLVNKPTTIKVCARDDIRDLLLAAEKDLFQEICLRYKIKVEFVSSPIQETDLKLPPYEIL